jgi:hypothetical protein
LHRSRHAIASAAGEIAGPTSGKLTRIVISGAAIRRGCHLAIAGKF